MFGVVEDTVAVGWYLREARAEIHVITSTMVLKVTLLILIAHGRES